MPRNTRISSTRRTLQWVSSQSPRPHVRAFSQRQCLQRPSPQPQQQPQPPQDDAKKPTNDEDNGGAMSRRLAEATEAALLEGGRAGRQAVEDAGFSEELKQRLLDKVAAQSFKAEYASAFAEAGLSSSAGQGTRDLATAQPWQGEESTQDTLLRMLNDAHKPLKPGLRGPSKVAPPPVDMRIRRSPRATSGQKIANARESAAFYASIKDDNLPDAEKEAFKKELKERFTPGARAMPNTMVGLAALANERIEDAIARGQFKNIPRGKGVQRDARADNPFIDTTEYIMNKMIQRQDIVPPWIEKQQELIKTANVFRARLRNDWKRHASRLISSRGGSLEEQIRLAELYARSEEVNNPRKRAVDQISVPSNATDDPVMAKMRQESPAISAAAGMAGVESALQTALHDVMEKSPVDESIKSTADKSTKSVVDESTRITAESTKSSADDSTPLPPPFRDSVWEKAETSYLTLAINNLNTITRSYNLMAPELAKKPYFSLDRELQSCYAEVAPQLAAAIRERAMQPPKKNLETFGGKPAGILDRMGGSTAKVRIHDETRPSYGFREFWKDLFIKKDS